MTQPRPITFLTALARGMRCRCPNCGGGKLFVRFLRVAETCNVCGEELNHHRADDLPAYILVALLGHILVIGATWVELAYSPPYWVHLAIWLPLTLLLAIGLLQPVKGAVVAAEWQMGLHGYHPSKQRRLGR